MEKMSVYGELLYYSDSPTSWTIRYVLQLPTRLMNSFFLSNQIDEENQMLGEYRPAGWAQNVLHPTPTLYSPPLAKSPLFASVLSPFILRWQSSEKRHIFHSCWLKGTNIQCKKCSNNGNEIIITFYFFCRICVEPKLDQTRLVCM